MAEKYQALANKFYKNIGNRPIFKAVDVHHVYEGDNRNLADFLKEPIIHDIYFDTSFSIQNSLNLESVSSLTLIVRNSWAIKRIASLSINSQDINLSYTSDDSGFTGAPTEGKNKLVISISTAQANAIIERASTQNSHIKVSITVEAPDDSMFTHAFVSLEAIGYKNSNSLFISSAFGDDKNDGRTFTTSKKTLASALGVISTNSLSGYSVYSSDTLASEPGIVVPARTYVDVRGGLLEGSLSIGSRSDVRYGIYTIGTEGVTIEANAQLSLQTLRGTTDLEVKIGSSDSDVHDITSLFIAESEDDDTNVYITISGTGWVYLFIPDNVNVKFRDDGGNELSDEGRWYGIANGLLRYGSSVPLSNNTIYLAQGGSDRRSGRSVETARRSLDGIDFTTSPYDTINRFVSLDNYAAVSGNPVQYEDVDNLHYDFGGVDLTDPIFILPNQRLTAKTLDADITFLGGEHETTSVELEEHSTGSSIMFTGTVTGNISIYIRKADYSFSSINRGTNSVSLHGKIGQVLSAPSVLAPGVLRTFNNNLTSAISIGDLATLNGIIMHIYMSYPGVVETGVISLQRATGAVLLSNLLEGGLASSFARLSTSIISGVVNLNIAGGTTGLLEVRYNILSSL